MIAVYVHASRIINPHICTSSFLIFVSPDDYTVDIRATLLSISQHHGHHQRSRGVGKGNYDGNSIGDSEVNNNCRNHIRASGQPRPSPRRNALRAHHFLRVIAPKTLAHHMSIPLLRLLMRLDKNNYVSSAHL